MRPRVFKCKKYQGAMSRMDKSICDGSQFLIKREAHKPTSRPCPEEGNESVKLIQLVSAIPEVAWMMAPVPRNPRWRISFIRKKLIAYVVPFDSIAPLSWFCFACWSSGYGFVAIFIMSLYTNNQIDNRVVFQGRSIIPAP